MILDIQIKHNFVVRDYLTNHLTNVYIYNFGLWVLFMLVMVLISAVLTRFLAPQAAGSGVSEMKVTKSQNLNASELINFIHTSQVVLRGVVLKGNFSIKSKLSADL